MKENRYIRRLSDSALRQFIADEREHKDVLLVEGARQVGKSRSVENALRHTSCAAVSINFERERALMQRVNACIDFKDFEAVLADELGFEGASGQVLFIDEAQESHSLGRFVRFMKEEWRHATVILTGSSLQRLFRGDTRFPVGRVRRLRISPFCFSEYLDAVEQSGLRDVIRGGTAEVPPMRHRALLRHYDDFLRLGGLPSIICQRAGSALAPTIADLLADYADDFVRILGEKDAAIASACLAAVANHLGNACKNTSVSSGASGAKSLRISEVFSRLEAWHFLLRSEQLSPSPEKSHNYLPKRYVFDTGIARYLREAATPSISVLDTLDADSRKPLGGILENQVAIDLARQSYDLCGWKRSPSGAEVDFVVKSGSTTMPIECKAAVQIGRRHIKGVQGYLAHYDLPVGVVVSFAPYEVFELTGGRRVVNVPAYRLEDFGVLGK
jgi:uncharacterized protein